MAAWRRLDGLHDPNAFRGWFLRIVWRKAIDRRRSLRSWFDRFSSSTSDDDRPIEFAAPDATPAREPLFDAAWVRPGTHVASMGSDAPGKHELPTELLSRVSLFCDLPSQSLQIGDFQHVRAAIEAGTLAVTPIGDVIEGRAQGRRSEDEITVFDSSGISLQDLYMADALIRAKASHG